MLGGGGGQLNYIVYAHNYANIQSVFWRAGPEQSLVLFSYLLLINICFLGAQVSTKLIKFEPRHEISNNVVWATSKASDQPALTRCQIRALLVA